MSGQLSRTLAAAAAALVFIAAVGLSGQSSSSLTSSSKAFVAQRSSLGAFVEASDLANWSGGARQSVRTTQGRFLFYFAGNEVVTVYREDADGRKEVWRKAGYQASPSAPGIVEGGAKNVAASAGLPPYKILSQVNLLTGGRYGEVLIASYSRKTPAKTREQALRAIAQKEGFQRAVLYATETAYKANNSAAFLKAHPTAMKVGFLGSLENGAFVSGEALYR